MAGLPTLNLRALLIGTMNPDGTGNPDIPIAIGTQASADEKFGEGSELAQMFRAYFANNFANEVWAGPVKPSTNSQPAYGTITVTTPPTEAGTINLYIAGHHVAVNVGMSDTAAQVATEITNAINSTVKPLPVTAVQGTGAATTGSGTGNSTGTTDLTVSASTGTIAIGADVTGAGVPANTKIASQTSGMIGGDGVYVTNNATTLSAATLTFNLANPTNIVTLTATFQGVNGNEIRVEQDYYGMLGGERPVTGLVLTLPPTGFLSNGVGTPDFTNLIVAMGETPFEYLCVPYWDSNTLLAFEEEMGFGDSGRWGWQRQLFGHVFLAKRGQYSDLVTWGLSRNSGLISVLAFEDPTPTPMYELAAAYTAKAQRALSNDPARPLQTLQLNGTLPAKLHDRFNFVELNSLASSGLAIQKCWEGSGMSQIAREQTTYQLNLYGQGDDAYELVTTLATLAKILRNQRHAITSKYPRHKLANDGTRFGPGQAIVTPAIIKAELIAQYRMDMWNGLVEDVADFKRFLLVERDPNNPNRLNVLYPPDLINQLRIFAVLAQFRLQYDRGIDVEIIGYTGLAGIAGPGGAITG
jgi:phage tail sheath gpL-like